MFKSGLYSFSLEFQEGENLSGGRTSVCAVDRSKQRMLWAKAEGDLKAQSSLYPNKDLTHKRCEMQESDLDQDKRRSGWEAYKASFPQSTLYCASFTVYTDFTPLDYGML